MTLQQQLAADPTFSVWVSASAGTGKTKVLTDRVLRLLLTGVDPRKILCLTFTRAAAAEMSSRVSSTLGTWTTLPKDSLERALSDILQREPKIEEFARARLLFAHVLDSNGGVKILTIHSFCQSLLSRFPLEAGLSPNFWVADERTTQELLREAEGRLLHLVQLGTDKKLSLAFRIITGRIGEYGFSKLMAELVGGRQKIFDIYSGPELEERIIDKIANLLGVDKQKSKETIIADACTDEVFPRAELEKISVQMKFGGKSDKDSGNIVYDWLVKDIPSRIDNYNLYQNVFLTKDGKPRAKLVSKALVQDDPDIEDVLRREQSRLIILSERVKAAIVLENSKALTYLGLRMLKCFQAEKNLYSLLDYEDQIIKTHHLLSNDDAAPWVLYKLDGGIEHILVDESQDTSPAQWAVIAALASEFFTTQDSSSINRTIFVVGDEKQSIFGFQGADLNVLSEMRALFHGQVTQAERRWREVPLERSFRSTVAILNAVDSIFATERAQRGVVNPTEGMRHEAERKGHGGLVELWPTCVSESKAASVDWDISSQQVAGEDVENRLAREIANKISSWVNQPVSRGDEGWLESHNRQIKAGDIMILVRTRGKFVSYLVSALKKLDVRVAGIDRMILTEQLAVMDLMALGDFILLPDDDLTLAALLKGPFIRFSEDNLFSLASKRKTNTLWGELIRRKHENKNFNRAYEFLSSFLENDKVIAPFEFYANFLSSRGGRRALIGSLGSQAIDPIDEFLSAAMSYEDTHVPSLQGFLSWLRAVKSEIKRDPQQARDEVRVMTIHGAKGLQSPIVFLPDTTSYPRDHQAVLWAADIDGVTLPLWPIRREWEEKITANARNKALEESMNEYRRLLYVAVTRSEDRLYVCGWHNTGNVSKDCWSELIRNGLENLDGIEDVTNEFKQGKGWLGSALRYSCSQIAKPSTESHELEKEYNFDAPKSWFTKNVFKEDVEPINVAPSGRIDAADIIRKSVNKQDPQALVTGKLVHRLLEILADQEAANRQKIGMNYVSNKKYGLSVDLQKVLVTSVRNIIENPEYAGLFGNNSRSEVPIAGIVGKKMVSGQIDRLVVEENRVCIIDFKTDEIIPNRDYEVSDRYLSQMAYYAVVLEAIFPKKDISPALLFTRGPKLLYLSKKALKGYVT